MAVFEPRDGGGLQWCRMHSGKSWGFTNGLEIQKEFGLDWYQMDFRMLDPETGRWKGIDPKADEWERPYGSMAGYPIAFADAEGDTIRLAAGVSEAFENLFFETAIHLNKT